MSIFEIVIPVFNEEETLRIKIMELYQFLCHSFSHMMWKIVIGDNGSTDRTLTIARSLQKEYPNIIAISVGEKGVGKALKFAWNQSQSQIIGCMDLDLSTDISHIGEAVEAITKKGYDLAYGTRLHKNSIVTGRSLKREITSRGFNFLIRKRLNVRISDGMCGFIFLKRSVFQRLASQGLRNDRWFFQTELLVLTEWFGYKIYELPVRWIDDQNSKVKVISLALEYLKDMNQLKNQKKTFSFSLYENS